MIIKGTLDGPKTFLEMGVLELNAVMSAQLMQVSSNQTPHTSTHTNI